MQFKKLGLNVRNAKAINIFKNKPYFSYHYNQKMVDVGASTVAGSSNGLVCKKLISIVFFLLFCYLLYLESGFFIRSQPYSS